MNLKLKSIKDSFIEKLDNKDLPKSRKGLPNLFVNTGLNTLDNANKQRDKRYYKSN